MSSNITDMFCSSYLSSFYLYIDCFISHPELRCNCTCFILSPIFSTFCRFSQTQYALERTRTYLLALCRHLWSITSLSHGGITIGCEAGRYSLVASIVLTRHQHVPLPANSVGLHSPMDKAVSLSLILPSLLLPSRSSSKSTSTPLAGRSRSRTSESLVW